MTDTESEHNQLIVDQFTRQAIPFAHLHSVEESMQLLIDSSGVSPADNVLDVACGPGIVACAFAPFAKHVTGIDLTPAMLDQARQLQEARHLGNMSWKVGDVTALPFSDGEFSIVISRYAFHHFLKPASVLKEMVRVCRPGGRIVVADVFTTHDAQAQAYDRMEKLRDPSHVRALRLEELKRMFADADLAAGRTDFYRFPVDLERILQSTCTKPADAERVRRIVADDVGKDVLGISAKYEASGLGFSFPVVVISGLRERASDVS